MHLRRLSGELLQRRRRVTASASRAASAAIFCPENPSRSFVRLFAAPFTARSNTCSFTWAFSRLSVNLEKSAAKVAVKGIVG
jgi:hypothetical protein